MRKEMIETAAFAVATQIRDVEDCIDSTIGAIAELQSRVMHANSVAYVGPATVHGALEQLSEALSSLVSARGAVVSCHGALADAKQKVPGLRTVGWGDGDNMCPPKTASADLRIVA